MKIKLKAIIRKDGTLEAVYHDFFRTLELGPFEVNRASYVDFDNMRQLWVAYRMRDDSVLAEHPNRDRCLELERQVVEQELMLENERTVSSVLGTGPG